MRDLNRIKPVLKELEDLWLENPDLRIGQLIMGITRTEETNPKLFYMEDDEFLIKLKEFKNMFYEIKRKNDELENFEVKDRKSFGDFIILLQKNLLEKPEDWENTSLSDFLEAISAYTNDIQGYYNNMEINIDADKPNWKTFADIFMGAKIYE